MADIAESVQDYYGKVLQATSDLKTNACKTGAALPPVIKAIVSEIHDDVVSKYYGCGLCVPQDFSLLKGLKVLDLGCGSGRDCYILSKLVGETGLVVGVDMTDEQLEVARKHIDYHTSKFGYSKPNVQFVKGHLEKLDELDLGDGTFDLIVSNCVINLTADKPKVLRDSFRLLKTGGELYFSDVYSDRRISEELRASKVLWGECLSGALYWNDFINMAKQSGFKDPRLVSDSRITISNAEIEQIIGHINFFSATYRLFKLADLEPACEDYGQAVIYKGTIPELRREFVLDNGHTIPAGKVFPVCGNTLSMLINTRFAQHFSVVGESTVHFGIFEGCGTGIPFKSARAADSSSAASASCAGGSCC